MLCTRVLLVKNSTGSSMKYQRMVATHTGTSQLNVRANKLTSIQDQVQDQDQDQDASDIVQFFFRQHVEIEHNMAMSTPVNQLRTNPNFANAPPAKLEEDMLVKGVIDEMENEVSHQTSTQDASKQYELQSKNVATFRHNRDEQRAQQQYPQHAHPYTSPHPLGNDTWWNKDDAQFAAIIALIALAVLYPTDMSRAYNSFDFLSKLEPYDMYIRTLLLGGLLYVIFRRKLLPI